MAEQSNKEPIKSDPLDETNRKLNSGRFLDNNLRVIRKDRQGGKSRDVSGGAFSRRSIRDMGAMTRKGFAETKRKGGLHPMIPNTAIFWCSTSNVQ